MKFIRVTSALEHNKNKVLYVNPKCIVSIFKGSLPLESIESTHIHVNDGCSNGYTLCVNESVEEVLKLLEGVE